MPQDESVGALTELGDFPEEISTPVGSPCAECDRAIEEGDRGRVIEWETADRRRVAYHRDCFEEAASMGIGG
jgi:DNA polymerase III gamma/tau subunit